MKRASPDARRWPASSHRRRCGGQSVISAEQLPPVDPGQVPPSCVLLSSRNEGFRIALTPSAHPASHVSLCGSVVLRAGRRVSRRIVVRHRTSDAVRCTVAPVCLTSLQQTGLEMVPCSTTRRRTEVGAHSCPAWMDAAGWGECGECGVLSIQRMFLPFDQIRAPSTTSSAGSSVLRTTL